MRKEGKTSKHLCKDCGKPIIPYEKGYKRCRACFFKSQKCEDCGRQIIPYVEGYTKCRSCFYNNKRLRNYSNNYLDNLEKPNSDNLLGSTKSYDSSQNYHSSWIDFEEVFSKFIIIVFVLGFIFPLVLFFVHPDMNYVIGNPKPLYFYDIDSDCTLYESNIVSSLNHLSQETGVKFVRLPSQVALLVGGVSYTCGEMMSTPGAVGESEAGFFAISFFVVAWNKINLFYSDEQTILHETLHSMGFGHSSNPGSIMYAYGSGQGIESDLSEFIKKWYAHDPVAYFDIIPLNLMWILIFLALIFWPK